MAKIRKRVLLQRDGTPSGAMAWVADFRDQAGKRRQRQFKRRKDAETFLEQALAQKRDGRYVHGPGSVQVVQAYDEWAAHLDARVTGGLRMEDATRRDYLSKMRLHALPHLGQLRLSQVTTPMVHRLKDDLLAAGQSPANCRKVLTVMVQFLRYCVERGMIPGNPALGVKVERTTRIYKGVTVPSREAMNTALAAADPDFRPMMALALFCGLRSSELRGLAWSDVDLAEGWLTVRQRADRRGVLGPPKSRAGNRRVPLGPMVVNTLRKWQVRCPPSKADLVFPNRRGKPRRHDNLLHRHWYPAAPSIGPRPCALARPAPLCRKPLDCPRRTAQGDHGICRPC